MRSLGVGEAIGLHHANFLLIPILDRSLSQPDNSRAQTLYKRLAEEEKIVVRFRGKEIGCLASLRITIGTPEENRALVEAMKKLLLQI